MGTKLMNSPARVGPTALTPWASVTRPGPSTPAATPLAPQVLAEPKREVPKYRIVTSHKPAAVPGSPGPYPGQVVSVKSAKCLTEDGLKINDDIERVGDLAVNTAERALFLCRQPPIEPPGDLIDMSRRTLSMLSGSLEALMHQDAQRARAVRQ